MRRPVIATAAFALVLSIAPVEAWSSESSGQQLAAGPLDDVLTTICETTGTAFLGDHPCEAWIARYEGPQRGMERTMGMAMSPDGGTLFLTGSSSLVTDWRVSSIVTVAYDTRTGNQIWSAEYDVPDGTDQPYPFSPITVSPDGQRVYVAGQTTGGGLGGDFITLAYDAATGSEAWRDRYDGPGHGWDVAFHVVTSADSSRVYVTGESTPAGSVDLDTETVAYDAATGERLWRTSYGASLGFRDFAMGQAISPDGTRLYTASGSWNNCEICGRGNADQDLAIAAYDTTDRGQRLWAKFYDDPEEVAEQAQALEISPDGKTLYLGATRGGATGLADHCITVAYNAVTGKVRWEARQAGPSCLVNDLSVSPDGSGVYLATTVATSAYDAATGAELWQRSEPGRTDQPRHQAVAVSPDSSKIMVVGQNPYDYWTVVYSAAAGEPIMRARLDMLDADDIPTLAAFAPDRPMVYVAGRTYQAENEPGTYEEDFLTVAYHLERPPFPQADRRSG